MILVIKLRKVGWSGHRTSIGVVKTHMSPWYENLSERDSFQYSGVDRRIILKSILEIIMGERGLVWLRIACCSKQCSGPSHSIKCREFGLIRQWLSHNVSWRDVRHSQTRKPRCWRQEVSQQQLFSTSLHDVPVLDVIRRCVTASRTCHTSICSKAQRATNWTLYKCVSPNSYLSVRSCFSSVVKRPDPLIGFSWNTTLQIITRLCEHTTVFV